MEKNCLNCRFVDLRVSEPPCYDCRSTDKWELWEPAEKHNCSDCKHGDKPFGQFPCDVCDTNDDRWEPEMEHAGIVEQIAAIDLKYIPTSQQEQEQEELKRCIDCKHCDLDGDEFPCSICGDVKADDMWEPRLPEAQPEVPTDPSHYQKGSIQPLEFIEANPHLGFHEGCIIKYLYRYKFKNGIEDLEKAQVYLDRLIGMVAGGESVER